jgi:[calcium/calmodulin-dependent protein kinase] kinase
MSEASSVDKHSNAVSSYSEDKQSHETSSDDTLNPPGNRFEQYDASDEGYSPDQEAAYSSEVEDDYDSSDSDGGLVMRRKSATKSPMVSSVAKDAGERSKERRGTGLSVRSKKSERSGSNNTMRRVRTRESAEEAGRRSLETSHE